MVTKHGGELSSGRLTMYTVNRKHTPKCFCHIFYKLWLRNHIVKRTYIPSRPTAFLVQSSATKLALRAVRTTMCCRSRQVSRGLRTFAYIHIHKLTRKHTLAYYIHTLFSNTINAQKQTYYRTYYLRLLYFSSLTLQHV